jgi:hypothetical protein
MSFYAGLMRVARKLLADKGQSITFTRTAATFDPVTGTSTNVTTTTFTGKGADIGYRLSEIDGAMIQRGDIRVILEATSTAPEIGDIATVNGRAMRVMNVNPTQPAGEVVFYDLQLRV